MWLIRLCDDCGHQLVNQAASELVSRATPLDQKGKRGLVTACTASCSATRSCVQSDPVISHMTRCHRYVTYSACHVCSQLRGVAYESKLGIGIVTLRKLKKLEEHTV